MQPASYDMAQILASSSNVALTLGTDLFVSRMPDQPDACVSVHDTGTYREVETTIEGDAIFHDTFQVRVRGAKNGFANAWIQAYYVQDALNLLTGIELNGARYIQIFDVAGISDLGVDEKDRPILIVNFRLQRVALSA